MSNKKKQAQVFHFDLYGKREDKYDFLNENYLDTIHWTELNPQEPELFFVPKDFDVKEEYDKGFSVSELFVLNNVGIVTAKDNILIDENKISLIKKVSEYYGIEANSTLVQRISYRPFDIRFVYFDTKFVERSREKIMQHFLKGENVGLVTARQCVGDWQYVFCTKLINEFNLTGTAGRFGSGNTFPLYLYPDIKEQESIATTPAPPYKGNNLITPSPPYKGGEQENIFKGGKLDRIPNLNPEIVNRIAERLGMRFVAEPKAPLLIKEGQGVVNKTQEQGVVNKTQELFKINNLPHLKTFKKELRNNLTPAEASLWTMLQGKQLDGRKFRRQHSVANYILDFYCPSERIAIELDGQGHFEKTKMEYDRERDLFLEYFGIKVLRFENKWVWDNPDGLLYEVKSWFGKQPPRQPLADTPPFQGGELNVFSPIDILDYIYAVLHSPTYREKYKEFLKIDFPRVPYPKCRDARPCVSTFWQLVKLGGEIRQIHLLESPTVEKYITQYPIDGDNVVIKPRFISSPPLEGLGEVSSLPPLDGLEEGYSPSPSGRDGVGSVYINDTHYFDNVPEVAWNFYIGGYQPAQKWLKDRKDRKLEFEDILHYQKIIVALSETDRIMKEIDKIEIE